MSRAGDVVPRRHARRTSVIPLVSCSLSQMRRLLAPIPLDSEPRDMEIFVRVHDRFVASPPPLIVVLKLPPDTRIPVVMADLVLNGDRQVQKIPGPADIDEPWPRPMASLRTDHLRGHILRLP